MGINSNNNTRKNRKHGEEPLVSNIFRLCRHLQVSKDFIQLDRNATLRRLQGNKRSRLKKDGPLALYCSSVLKGECINFGPLARYCSSVLKGERINCLKVLQTTPTPPIPIVSVNLISERKEQQDNVRVADHEYDSGSEISQIAKKLRFSLHGIGKKKALEQSVLSRGKWTTEENDKLAR